MSFIFLRPSAKSCVFCWWDGVIASADQWWSGKCYCLLPKYLYLTCTWLKKYLMYLMSSKYSEYLNLYLYLQIWKSTCTWLKYFEKYLTPTLQMANAVAEYKSCTDLTSSISHKCWSATVSNVIILLVLYRNQYMYLTSPGQGSAEPSESVYMYFSSPHVLQWHGNGTLIQANAFYNSFVRLTSLVQNQIW